MDKAQSGDVPPKLADEEGTAVGENNNDSSPSACTEQLIHQKFVSVALMNAYKLVSTGTSTGDHALKPKYERPPACFMHPGWRNRVPLVCLYMLPSRCR